MPQWAGSCWYYLRYLDPKNDRAFCDPAKLKHWMPVDLYVGGAEHAVLHLLYSRFWHKVLFDRGHVPVPEPFQRLVNQGMILGEIGISPASRTATGESRTSAVGVDFDARNDEATNGRSGDEAELVKLDGGAVVEKQGDTFSLQGHDLELPSMLGPYKMSKAAATSSIPTTSSSEYGADSLRLYEMFMGPLEAVKPWSMRGVEGVYRFLSRVWRLIDRRSRRGDEAVPTRCRTWSRTAKRSGCCTAPSSASPTTWRRCRSTPPSPR